MIFIKYIELIETLCGSHLHKNVTMLVKLIAVLLIYLNSHEVSTQDEPQCMPEEEWNSCTNPCEATCQRPLPQGCDQLKCVGACVCSKGHIREFRNGGCIRNDTCRDSCRPHETFNECGSPCPATCQDQFPSCIKTCVGGCFCASNYIFSNNFDDVCILQTSCVLVE